MKEEYINYFKSRRYFVLWLFFITPFLVKAQPKIGAFYFDAWTQFQWDNYKNKGFQKGAYNDILINDFFIRESAYGWITSSQEKIEQQIDDAAFAELDFFIFNWYYCQNDGYTNCFLNNALHYFMKAKNKEKLSFCTMITNDTFDIGPSQWDETKIGLFTQFLNPAYYKINGRPLVIIYQGDRIINSFGGIKLFDMVLKKFKEESISNGLGNPLIGIMNIEQNSFKKLKNIDFLSTYNDPKALNRIYNDFDSHQEYSYKDLQKGEQLNWYESLYFLNRKKFYIPTITSGWDPRPWSGKNEFDEWQEKYWYQRATKSELKQSVLNAYNFNRDYYTRNKYEIIFINAWNEYGEGGYISRMKNGEFLGEAIKDAKKEIE
ncbi:glycoside hydrolase family 99-like domain-containing protein [Empedobacter falsenii]